MGLVAKGSSGGNFIQVPIGMHLARCYRIVDLGTQESQYMGNVKHLHKVMIQFEVHSEDSHGNPTKTAEGKPLTINKTYTLTTADKSSLRKDLETWRGKALTKEEAHNFELENILGQWGMLSVVETQNNGNTYTNIATINPVPPTIKKSGLPDGYNPTNLFSISDPNMEVFESFSDNLKEKIKKSPEWQKSQGTVSYDNGFTEVAADKSSFDDMENDLPF